MKPSESGAANLPQAYANHIRRRRPKPADKWHLDEVVIKIKGKKY